MIRMISSLIDVIMKHGTIIGISVVIVAVVAWNVHAVRDSILVAIGIGTHTQQMRTKSEIDNIKAELDKNTVITDEISESIRDMRHYQLMTIITNESLPIELRLSAYDEYILCGYNSWIHLYYEKKLEPLSKDIMNYHFSAITEWQVKN